MDIWFSPAGDRGFRRLRAGWRFALYGLAVLYLFLPHAASYAVAAAQPAEIAVSEAVVLAWVAIATLLLALLEGRPFGDFGTPARSAFRGPFWRGVAWGAASLTLLLALIAATGDYHLGHPQLRGAPLLASALAWAVAFLIVAFFEELCFRGYALTTLSQGMGFWPAAVLLSILFAAVHLGNGGESYVGVLGAGLIGLFFCFTKRRTGNLWFAIGMHASWDYCESFVYGVPDSGTTSAGRLLAPSFHGSHWITGGSVGPEASLFLFAVVALLFVVFAFSSRNSPDT